MKKISQSIEILMKMKIEILKIEILSIFLKLRISSKQHQSDAIEADHASIRLKS